ncbi:phage tail protein [Mergibacter septicus]|uniref:Phage tail protein n=1 Tax=Mergibacter septicus TaxID=221402 RepID=A0A8E3MG83_9PAST|nr:tail protein X [Mergibacter septicus]AWX15608.1 phage tail protein [Mergibacter septicus]QDJ14862.1 phage tail protein [Mergibacter septicus]UTU47710.1 tail protein X [Mergibacter septicus]WMR96683.1 tail protein X [Mergibacter septicus]
MKVKALQGDTLDLIVYRHLGNSQGLLEQALLLNPHILADVVIPIGTEIELPRQIKKTKVKQSINLWD